MKLLVDDEEIGEFVQVLTLADSGILCSAIEARFKKNSAVTGTAVNVVEHIQKVFLCHLRLPSISDKDVMDLVQHYAKEFGVDVSDDTPSVLETITENTSSSGVRQTQHESTEEDVGDFILSESEVNSLKVALGSHVNVYKIPMTPRSVRSFLFKYQILRMILRLNGVEFDPQVLADLLNREIAISLGAGVFPDASAPTELLQYVKMVA